MPWPTKAEEEAVEKKIRIIRRRLHRETNKAVPVYPGQYVSALTDMTTWRTRLTDPHEVDRGNTDHCSVMRTQADALVAQQQRLKEEATKKQLMSGDMQPAPGGSTLGWPDRSICCQGTPFPDLPLGALGGGLPGGGINTSRKRRIIRKIDRDTSFYRDAREGYVYWPIFRPHTFSRRKRKDYDDFITW